MFLSGVIIMSEIMHSIVYEILYRGGTSTKMKLVIGRFNAALTISVELRKILLLQRVAILLSLPKRTRLLFLTGLIRLFFCQVAQIAAVITPSDKKPAVRTILETVCQPIVKTGPPISSSPYQLTLSITFKAHNAVN